MLQGMSETHARRIEQARADGPFHLLEDFTRRTGLGRGVSSRLAKAGAFGSLELDRRTALWHALGQDQKELPLFDSQESRVREAHRSRETDTNEDHLVRSTHPTKVDLPKMSPAEEVLADYRSMGLSLDAHPMQFLRPGLEASGVARAEQLKVLPNHRPVAVAGIVLVRQRPGTAKGITFVTLEDETGTANLIIRQQVWRRYREAALGAQVLLARGKLQREGQVIHVLCTKLENLSGRMRELAAKSRDFC
jgi:error-prone DNA polymerase